MFTKKIKSLALASMLALSAVAATSCGGDADEDGYKYYNTYYFYCSGGQLDDGHSNLLTLNSSNNSVSASDFYMVYDYVGSFKVQGSGKYSGTIAKGKTLKVSGLYAWIAGSRVNASGNVTINKLDTVRDYKADGEVSYDFTT